MNSPTAYRVGIMLGVAVLTSGAWGAPDWWTHRNVTTGPTAGDYAPVNAGQVKHVAAMAADEMEAHLPGGAGAAVLARVAGFGLTNNYVPVNNGQLKNLAKPFYDRLMSAGYPTNYPWAGSTNQPTDYAPANIGQVKHLFEFDFGDGDEDGMADWWERRYGLNETEPGMYQDTDLDGLSDLTEYQRGTSPVNWDTDADGISDRDELVSGTDPAVSNVNTVVGTVSVVSSSNALGATVLSIGFNTNALRILAAGAAGTMKAPEFTYGQTINYTSGTARVAYYQAKSTSGPTGTIQALKIMFAKVGTSGTPTSVTVTHVQMKQAPSGTNFTPVSVTMAGIPGSLP